MKKTVTKKAPTRKKVTRKKKVIANKVPDGPVKRFVNGLLSSALFGGGDPTGLQGYQTDQLSQTGTLLNTVRQYLISNNRVLLAHLYVENGLIRTIVDIPVDDGLSGEIEIKTALLDDEELELLKNKMAREGVSSHRIDSL